MASGLTGLPFIHLFGVSYAAVSVFSFIEVLLLYFFKGLAGLFTGFITYVSNAESTAFNTLFSNYANTLDGYGIWSLPLGVVVFIVGGVGVYAVITVLLMINDAE